MEPATRVLSHESTRSYLERELIVSLNNNGPMIGPNLETMDTHDDDYYRSRDQEKNGVDMVTTAESIASSTIEGEEGIVEKKRKWWQLNKPDTTTNPRQYPPFKKNMILLVVAIAGSISPVSSTIYYPALVTMQDYFNTTDTAMNASLSIFTFFTAFFPLIWATFGDVFGRRKIYVISFFISFVGAICCCVSVNVEMFIVFRAFSAIGSSSAMSMGAGTIADIFEPHERGRAFAYYTCGPLLGPAIGPIIGGYLNQGLGWRSNFAFLAIFGFFTWLGIVFFLPETWRASPKKIVDIEKEGQEQQDKKKKRRVINPIAALRLFKFTNISLTIVFTACLFFVLYLNSTNFTRIYTIQYGFDSGLVGVCYLPSAAGSMLGGVLGGRISDRDYTRRVEKAKAKGGGIYPEMRIGLLFFFVTIIIQLFGFVAFGWCIQENVHFAYGLVCQFFIGFALMVPNVTLNAYMVDCFRTQGASVTACNNFARYIMAGTGSLIASDIYRAMGSGPLFTFCGCLLAVAFVCLYIVKKYHYKWALMREQFNSSS